MKSITYTRKRIKKELEQELEMLESHISQLKDFLYSDISKKVAIKEKLKNFDSVTGILETLDDSKDFIQSKE